METSDTKKIEAGQEIHKSGALVDTQNQKDERCIPIDKVGVRGMRFPVQVRDRARHHQDTIGLAT